MSSDGKHMTWLGGVKQKIQYLNAGFEFLVNEIKCSTDGKFNDNNDKLKDIRRTLQSQYMM